MVEIKKALELKQELDTLRPINTEQEKRIMQKFRLDWNYHSNHLEGNSLTYGETKALLLFGVTAQGKPLKDTLEITGHNEAINWVIDVVKKDYPLTENFIRELHSLLLKDSYKESINEEGKIVSRRISAGKYKSNPNHVLTATGETFYFATPEETPAKMYDLLNWYKEKTEEKDVNPIFIAAEFHYKFIRIHPFDDGNGRTARIVMNFILMQFGFPPVIIKTQDKENYFAVLRLADAGNLEAFVTYIAENLNVSLEIMIAGAKGENIEEEDDLDKEIALLEQRLKIVDNKLENKIENLSISLIDLIDNFYLSQSKFKKLYKFYDFKFYINDELFHFDRNKILNYFSDSLSKKNVYLEIYLIYNFSSFFEWEDNDVNYSVNLEIEFKQNNYSIAINQEVILEKEQLQPIDKNDISIIISKLNIVHKEFIEQKIAEKENK
jgi:Fic family protein